MYGWYQYLAIVDHCRHRRAAVWHQKLGSIGSDLGASIKGFKKAMSDDENKQEKSSQDADFTAKSITDKQDEAKKKTLNATIKSRCNSCSTLVLVNCCWSL
jgi:sec-independent protein translocase protein TatA